MSLVHSSADGASIPTEGEATIWLVGATVGEWEWMVCARWSEDEAKAFVERIEGLTRIADGLADKRFDDDEHEARWSAAVADCKSMDAGWSDYGGKGPTYTAWPMTVPPRSVGMEPE